MSHIPSLANPPNAPKKKSTRVPKPYRLQRIPPLQLPGKEEEKAGWCFLRDSGYVREKYLRYTPEDVEEIDDLDTLTDLLHWYNPPSQPHNFYEACYLTLMLEAVRARLYVL